MRLLLRQSDGSFSLTEDRISNVPPYAILSHTWGADEVTFKDISNNTGKKKNGYKKIRFCGIQAAKDGLQYIWVDNCCIDKSSSAELAEAINSMFRWYRAAARCYVYLSDVSKGGHKSLWNEAFEMSRWFTGWTLQELIAPASVEFFSTEMLRLGDKNSLELQIHKVTGIPTQALRGSSLSDFTVAERMSWARKRETIRKEDEAYCLLGIFGVHIPLIYGEREGAFERLVEAIDKRSNGKFFTLIPWRVSKKLPKPAVSTSLINPNLSRQTVAADFLALFSSFKDTTSPRTRCDGWTNARSEGFLA